MYVSTQAWGSIPSDNYRVRTPRTQRKYRYLGSILEVNLEIILISMTVYKWSLLPILHEYVITLTCVWREITVLWWACGEHLSRYLDVKTEVRTCILLGRDDTDIVKYKLWALCMSRWNTKSPPCKRIGNVCHTSSRVIHRRISNSVRSVLLGESLKSSN